MTVLFSPATGGIGALNGLLAGGFFQSVEESSRWGGRWWVDCSGDWRFLDSKRRVSGRILPPTGDFARWDSVLCGFHRLIGFVPIGFVPIGFAPIGFVAIGLCGLLALRWLVDLFWVEKHFV